MRSLSMLPVSLSMPFIPSPTSLISGYDISGRYKCMICKCVYASGIHVNIYRYYYKCGGIYYTCMPGMYKCITHKIASV